MQMPTRCERCGATFSPRGSRRRYCSARCAAASRRHPRETEVAAALRQHQPHSEIRAAFGVGEKCLYDIGRRHGIRGTAPRVPDAEAWAMWDAYRSGQTIVTVGAMFGRSASAVYHAFRKRGWKAREPGRARHPAEGEIAEALRQSISQSAVAARFGVHQSLVSRIGFRHGIPRLSRRTITPTDEAAIAADYTRSRSVEEVAFRHRVGLADVVRCVQERGGTVERHHQGFRRRLAINDAAFSKDNLVARYWAMFLLADGSVHRNRHGHHIKVALQKRDEGHLLLLADFLGVDRQRVHTRQTKIQDKVHACAELRVTSRAMFENLNTLWWVRPRKSKVARMPERLRSCPASWRGYLDGDGSVTCAPARAKSVIQLVGSKELCEDFAWFAASLGIPTGAVHRSKSIWAVSIHGAAAAAMARVLLARGPTIGLTRKTESLRNVARQWSGAELAMTRAERNAVASRQRWNTNPRLLARRLPERTCRVCGRSFNSDQRSAFCCSRACADLHRRKLPASARCEHCGAEFRPRWSPGQRYCSYPCSVEARKATRNDEIAAVRARVANGEATLSCRRCSKEWPLDCFAETRGKRTSLCVFCRARYLAERKRVLRRLARAGHLTAQPSPGPNHREPRT